MNAEEIKTQQRLGRFRNLLTDLIYQLQDGRRPHGDLDYLDVKFFTKRGRLITDQISVAQALDCLANDVFHFEDFDLDQTFRLEVFCR